MVLSGSVLGVGASLETVKEEVINMSNWQQGPFTFTEQTLIHGTPLTPEKQLAGQ